MKRLLLILCLLFPAGLMAQTTYYVSSSGGSDTNSGTSESQPWKTLTKVNSLKPSPGDQILFKSGDVWEGTLIVNSSGSSGNPIVYREYGTGAKPIISGFTTITSGWTNEGSGIYSKVITSDSQTNMVTIDGVEYGMGRYPNSSYLIYESANTDVSITDNELTSTPNWTGAEVVIRKNDWRLDRCLISNHIGTTITYTNAPSSWKGTPGNGYFIQNSLTTLDQFGEWYHNTSTGKFYMYFGAVDPSTKTVKVATINNVVINAGKQYVTIRNLDIQGAIENAVYNSSQSNNFTVQNCNISFAGDYGIYINSQNGLVDGNTIHDCNQVAVKGAGSIAVNVTNNKISRIGIIKGSSKSYYNAIMFNYNNDGTQIKYNTIDNVGYDGILLYGDNTTIQYNFINHSCLILNDGGGIYTAGSTGNTGMLIDHNIVLNTTGNTDGGNTSYPIAEGIYLDEYANGITVSNNTVAYSAYSGIKLHKAHDNSISNNILFKNGSSGIYLQNSSGSADNLVNNVINNNQFAAGSGKYTIYILDLYATSPTAINSDYNYFCLPSSSQAAFRTFYNGGYTYRTLSTWQSYSGKDGHSSLSSGIADYTNDIQLVYNNTKQAKTFDTGGSTFKDIAGNTVSGSFILQPYTSIILIGSGSVSTSSINQSPVISNQSFTVQAPLAPNDLIGQVVASDPDAGQTLTYAITSGNTSSLFVIDAASGDITANTDISVTSDQSYSLTIQVTDDASAPLSAAATVTINVKAGSSGPDTINPTISGFVIPATSSSLTIPITDFTASDNVGVSGYLLTETNTTPSVNDTGWTSSAPTSYTFAQEGNLTLYAWVKDSTGNISSPLSASVTITLPDLSPTFSEYKFEETSGTTVIDSNGSNDGTIINNASRLTGAIGQGLEFTGSGYITAGQSFSNNVQQEVTLAAWLKPNPSSTGYQGIIMHGGPNIDTYALYILPDSKRIAFKTSGTSSSWFYIDNIDQLWDGNWHQVVVTYDGSQKTIYLDGTVLTTVAASGVIDSGDGYNLLIGAGRDETNPTLLYQGQIDEVRVYNTALSASGVSDLYNLINQVVPNQAPVIADQSFDISTAKTKGDLIGKVVASDPDAGQTLSYSIVQGNGAGYFSIIPTTGEIIANTDISTTVDQTIILGVKVTDDGLTPLSSTANVTIHIIGATPTVDVNQAPVILSQSFSATAPISANELIGQVVASDADTNQTLTYSIISGNGSGLFAINPVSGEIYANTDIITYTDQTTILGIRVTDNATVPLSSDANATINIIGATVANQAPSISDQAFDVQAPLASADLIGQVIASDPDAGQTLSYSILSGNDAGLFYIDNATGEIYANTDIHTSIDKNIVLTVEVKDNATNSLSAQAGITINIAAEPNQSPVISDQTFQIRKNDQVGDIIGQVIASDPDAVQTLTYSITSGNDNNYFSIDATSGNLYVNSAISVTSSTSIVIAVQVTDDGSLPLSSSANITIDIPLNGKISTGVVKNSKKDQIILMSTDPLQTTTLKSTALISSFVLNDNKKVTNVTIIGSEIYLDVNSKYKYGDEIKVSYQPGEVPLYDSNGNEIESFSNLEVTNNVLEESGISTDYYEMEVPEVNVYPTPSDGRFTIKANNLQVEQCEVSMFSLNGQVVMQKQIQTFSGNLEENFNMPGLSKGTYIIRLIIGSVPIQKKIIMM